MTSAIDFDLPLETQAAHTWEFTRELQRVEDSLRKQHPFIRLWDSEWDMHHSVGVERKATFSWISNDSGPGQIEVPFGVKRNSGSRVRFTTTKAASPGVREETSTSRLTTAAHGGQAEWTSTT